MFFTKSLLGVVVVIGARNLIVLGEASRGRSLFAGGGEDIEKERKKKRKYIE